MTLLPADSVDARWVSREYQRSFQCPTGLDDRSRVSLEVAYRSSDGLCPLVECLLNGQELAPNPLGQPENGLRYFRVPLDSLRGTNLLAVRVSGPQPEEDSNNSGATLPQVVLVLAGTADFGN